MPSKQLVDLVNRLKKSGITDQLYSAAFKNFDIFTRKDRFTTRRWGQIVSARW